MEMPNPQQMHLLPRKGPYKPTLIIHGGAGNITRPNLPPTLYEQYHDSLLNYLESTQNLLNNGADAVEAACHAVSLMEDDPLFNCGRGSVFTIEGSIEMEASLMVSTVGDFTLSNKTELQLESGERGAQKLVGRTKKNAAVSMIKRTRHPILLAREVLAMSDVDAGTNSPTSKDPDPNHQDGDASGHASSVHDSHLGDMHGHLSGQWIEDWGFAERGLERKGHKWFWTRKRWEEHRRGLGLDTTDQAWVHGLRQETSSFGEESEDDVEDIMLLEDHTHALHSVKEVPSQGTVGAVCMDAWGNLCVATSTGGLTNKRTGRIGDTPTVGAGFWAESWDEQIHDLVSLQTTQPLSLTARNIREAFIRGANFWLGDCLPAITHQPLITFSPADRTANGPLTRMVICEKQPSNDTTHSSDNEYSSRQEQNSVVRQRRAIAMSGTGNGDSFLRTNAVRTAASITRFSTSLKAPHQVVSLQEGVTAVAGPNGELQRSAEGRWGKTGEGEGGIIGIEAIKRIPNENEDAFNSHMEANIVFDFNCGGMWRAYYETEQNGTAKPRIMVFKEEYRT